MWKNCDKCFENVKEVGSVETRDFYCDGIVHGRYVVIRLNQNAILTLCEVKIFSSRGIEGKIISQCIHLFLFSCKMRLSPHRVDS